MNNIKGKKRIGRGSTFSPFFYTIATKKLSFPFINVVMYSFTHSDFS